MDTKKKVMDDSRNTVNVEDISSNSVIDYCILGNADTDFFDGSNL